MCGKGETVSAVAQLPAGKALTVRASTDVFPDSLGDPGTARDHGIGAGRTALVVPAGTRAVFTTSGPAPQAIRELWRDVFTEWSPSNPYRTRAGPRILRAPLSRKRTEADAELWLPVESEHG